MESANLPKLKSTSFFYKMWFPNWYYCVQSISAEKLSSSPRQEPTQSGDLSARNQSNLCWLPHVTALPDPCKQNGMGVHVMKCSPYTVYPVIETTALPLLLTVEMYHVFIYIINFHILTTSEIELISSTQSILLL